MSQSGEGRATGLPGPFPQTSVGQKQLHHMYLSSKLLPAEKGEKIKWYTDLNQLPLHVCPVHGLNGRCCEDNALEIEDIFSNDMTSERFIFYTVATIKRVLSTNRE